MGLLYYLAGKKNTRRLKKWWNRDNVGLIKSLSSDLDNVYQERDSAKTAAEEAYKMRDVALSERGSLEAVIESQRDTISAFNLRLEEEARRRERMINEKVAEIALGLQKKVGELSEAYQQRCRELFTSKFYSLSPQEAIKLLPQQDVLSKIFQVICLEKGLQDMPLALSYKNGAQFLPEFSKYCPLGSQELSDIIQNNLPRIMGDADSGKTYGKKEFSYIQKKEFGLRFYPLRAEGQWEPYAILVSATPLGSKRMPRKIFRTFKRHFNRTISWIGGLGSIAKHYPQEEYKNGT